MSNWFNIDWERLVVWNLPGFLRTIVRVKWLQVLLKPLHTVHLSFIAFSEEQRYKLSHNSQVIYLEAVLNDRFDNVLRRIRIINQKVWEPLYVYDTSDGRPVFLYEPSDNRPVYVYNQADYEIEMPDFIVEVPQDLRPGTNDAEEAFITEMETLINYYKLYSKKISNHMDKLRIQATGFPLTTETLKFMRDTYEILYGAFGNAVHPNDNIILYGMEPTGGNIKDGYAVIKGEVLPFIGGTNTGTIILKEEVVDAAYNDNLQDPSQITNYPTYYTRYLTTGNPGEGEADWPFNTFKRLKSLIDISDAVEQATTTRKGIIELATQSEVNNGTDNQRAVTPSTLANRTATETRKGVIEIATQAEVDAGTDDSRAVTPAKLAGRLSGYKKVLASGYDVSSGAYNGSSDHTTFGQFTVNLPHAVPNADYRVSGSITWKVTSGAADLTKTLWYVRNRQDDQLEIYYEVHHQGLNTQDYSIQVRFDYVVIEP